MKTITLTTEHAQQIEEIVEHLLVDHPTARHHKACVEALSIIRAARAQEQAEQEPVAQQDSDDRRLLREIFMLCEATEELESTNDFMRGRIFEAKCIRRGIGTWYQDTFCGRSYMGEPVLNAAPVQQAEQEPLTGHELYAAPVQPMNQEPVFRCANCECIYSEKVTQCDCMPDVQEWIEGTMSFNAAPVRTKDLTADEITLVAHETMEGDLLDLPTFARAIVTADREKNRA